MNNFTRLQVAGYMGIKVWIARRKDFGILNVQASINLLNPSQDEMEQALDTAERDNYKHIVCYELDDSEFQHRQQYYVGRE